MDLPSVISGIHTNECKNLSKQNMLFLSRLVPHRYSCRQLPVVENMDLIYTSHTHCHDLNIFLIFPWKEYTERLEYWHVVECNLKESSSSFLSGSPRVTITPQFILAGSKAQWEIPMKATRCCHSIICYIHISLNQSCTC